MSDFAEDMAAWSEHKRQKRASNTEASTQMLIDAGIPFTSLNGGVHIRFAVVGYVIDFWPSTGLWHANGWKYKTRGVRSLLKFVKEKGLP